MGEPSAQAPVTIDSEPRERRVAAFAFPLILVLIALVWGDLRWSWTASAFDIIGRQFYEVPGVAAIRRPSQISLFRVHLAIVAGLAAAGLVASPWMDRHGRRWWAVFVLGYAIRATAWIAGGNLPMVSGDSPHYVEVASSILRGEGPVKHYVESFFIDYPAIRRGEGALDDWATPLYPYLLAGAYRLTGVVPGESLETTIAVDKGLSFVLNVLCLPALYAFARRRFNRDVALGAMALLAILPVHAIYAGFDLRESLVALTSIVAVWSLTEVWAAEGLAAWGSAVVAGALAGAAILARNTAIALAATAGLYGVISHPRKLGPMFVWGLVCLAGVAPWAWATYQTYGRPFYSYTDFFQHTFSWTVHHYQAGIPRAADFYARENLAEIVRVKIKALFIIVGYSTMILSLPLMLAFWRRALSRRRNEIDRLVAWIAMVFVISTLVRIADVTQVAQLGRYYLPVFCLMLPTAAAGLADWWKDWQVQKRAAAPLALSLVALLWADPTWAYDATWFAKPYQLHLPALRATGDWIKAHPDQVAPNARVMTWFPWEFRLVSGRTTVLLPRNFNPARIDQVIRQYGVTHLLWGSFEPPPNVDPESFGPFLSGIRTSLGLTDSREIYRSPRDLPFGVRLYRLSGTAP
jgi:4-amino-4-deoxy-L-arabinose transferase-like glycosyltransferase